MPKHKDKGPDEELRSQDHALLNKTGSTFSSIQNLCSSSSSTSRVFGVSNISGIDFKSTPPAFYSCSSNGGTSVIFGVSKAPAFAAGSGSSGVSTGIACAFPGSTFSSIQNLCSSSSSTSTVFGVSNISGIDFKSKPPAFYSCSSNGGTNVIFGVSKAPAFAAGSGSSGVITGITCAFPGSSSIIGRSESCAIQKSTTPGFGIKSTASSYSASGTSSIFGIPSFPGSQCAIKTEPTNGGVHLQGSGVAFYSETREVNETDKNGTVEKTQLISVTPVDRVKSQKTLRSEDYELRNKGGHTLSGDQSSAKADFKTCEPFKSNLFPLSPSPNSFFSVNLNPSRPIAFKPASRMPAFNANPNPSSLIPYKEPTNSCKSTLSPITQFTSVSAFQPFKSDNLFAPPNNTISSSASTRSPSDCPFSPANHNPFPFNTMPNPFSFIFPNEPANNTFFSGKLSPTLNTSQLADKIDSYFTKKYSLPSQASNGLTMATEVGCQNINGQQYVPVSTVDVLRKAPFPARSEIGRPNTVLLTSDQHVISSSPDPNRPRKKIKRKKRDELSLNSGVSLLRTRHELSRHDSSPGQRYISPSSEPKCCLPITQVPIVDKRESPYVWVRNPLSLHPSSDGKGCDYKDLFATSNLHLNDETTSVIAKKHEADVLALMPKLPNGDEYYTEPSLNELAAKEMAEPGSLSRVNDFVFGRLGYGNVKFLGETDVRHLDLGPIVQFNNREVIVYEDDRTKPPVGQGLNKPAEVTLLNVKCVSKRKRKQHIEGPVFESYKEMLIKKGLEQGAEFVSYDPVRGEWKFRVQQF